MHNPLLTIGLPVYNAAPYLEDTLRSIFAQTFTEGELIIVDDGSTDHSREIVSTLGDERVQVVTDGKHLGLAARLNTIVRLARGKYVARMDADDLMHPNRLRAQVDFLIRHPAVDGLGCGLVILDRNG